MVNRKIIVLSLLFMFALSASVALAATPPSQKGVDFNDPNKIVTLIQDIALYFQAIVLIIAVIMIMWSAFLWMTSAGDETKVGDARKTLIYALIGIAVVLVAYAAEAFIIKLLS